MFWQDNESWQLSFSWPGPRAHEKVCNGNFCQQHPFFFSFIGKKCHCLKSGNQKVWMKIVGFNWLIALWNLSYHGYNYNYIFSYTESPSPGGKRPDDILDDKDHNYLNVIAGGILLLVPHIPRAQCTSMNWACGVRLYTHSILMYYVMYLICITLSLGLSNDKLLVF